MNDESGISSVPYEEIMQAIGYFIDRNSLREITLVELREGILVRGIAYTAERSGYQTVSTSYLFTHDDLVRIVNENDERRKQAQDAAVAAAMQQQQRGGLFHK